MLSSPACRAARLCRLLPNDSEQPLFIEASEIWANWFGLTDHGLMARKGLCESPEAAIGIDVIDHDRTARPQGCPSEISFETNVVFAMKAIVNKKINLAKFRK